MSAVYFHVPFCVKRCYYCDFITYAGQGHLLTNYHLAMLAELEHHRQDLSNAVSSLYFGGGTPSLMKPEMVATLITKVNSQFGIDEVAEITLEANPGTITLDSSRNFGIAGVNRLSLGIQSFDDDDLTILGRIHTVRQAEDAIQFARQAGFENLSLDLIFGIPGQGMRSWQRNLERAVEMGLEHLSLYSLILEEGTVFAERVEKGELVLPEEDLVADMYEWAMDWLPAQGYHQYEISNWARAEHLESRHNKVYWHNLDYLGIGAGAHGRLNGWRYHNLDLIPAYIKSMADDELPVADRLSISGYDEMQEHLMLGLRLTREGISQTGFQLLYGQTLEQVFGAEIAGLFQKGLLEWVEFGDGRHLRLTRRGILFGNQVFQEFV